MPYESDYCYRMRYLFLILFAFSLPLHAAERGWSLDPHAAVGFNTAQGTHVMLGVDFAMQMSEQLRTGVGAYLSVGGEPEHDREWGIGPFVSFVQPFASFLMGQVRQEINYVDLHDPVKTVTASGTRYTHNAEQGVASVTSASLHLFFTPNFVLSGGYRFVLGLTNSALDDGRSGTFLGVSIGF